MKLFTGTIEYAKTLIEITDQDLAIKKQTRKTFQSNHPNVLKQQPKSIAKRISDTSFSKDIFDKPISIYQNALSESRFEEKLKYAPNITSFQEENNQRIRRRKIIWFNPPYSRRENEHW